MCSHANKKHIPRTLKYIKTLFCCSLVSFTLSACSDNFTETENALKAVADEAQISGSTITIMASADWIKDSERTLGTKFESITGVQVNYELYPDDLYLKELFARLGTENAPDIFLTQSGMAIQNTYHLDQYAIPLNQEPWMQYYDEFTANETSIQGINYGMTYYDNTTDYYLIYNKRILENAGITEIPTTFTEFDRMCSRILAQGVTPLYEPMADGWHQTMLFAENGQVFNHLEPGLFEKLNRNETTFAQNASMRLALEQIQSLAQKGYMGQSFATDTFDASIGYLASGEYAMCMLKPGSIDSIIDSDLNNGFKREDFGIMLLPICDNQILNVHPTGPSHFIHKDSEHITAARLYLGYIAEPENIQYTIDNTGEFENLPFNMGQKTRYNTVTSSFLAGYDDSNSATVLQDEVTYFNEQWGEVSADLLRLCQGEITATQLLEAIDERRAEFAHSANDPAWK